jgi:hypothetical protein
MPGFLRQGFLKKEEPQVQSDSVTSIFESPTAKRVEAIRCPRCKVPMNSKDTATWCSFYYCTRTKIRSQAEYEQGLAVERMKNAAERLKNKQKKLKGSSNE